MPLFVYRVRSCENKTCQKLYRRTDINQKYCSKACKVAEASRRKKKRRAMREEVARQRKIAEERLDRLSDLAGLLAAHPTIRASKALPGALVVDGVIMIPPLPKGHSYHSIPRRQVQTDGRLKAMVYDISLAMRDQMEWIEKNRPGNEGDAYTAAAKDNIIALATVIKKWRLTKTSISSTFTAAGKARTHTTNKEYNESRN